MGVIFSYESEIAIIDNSPCVGQGIEDIFNSLVCAHGSKSCGVMQSSEGFKSLQNYVL